MTNTYSHLAVKVCEHPLVNHHLSILRNKTSTHEQFRNAGRRVAQLILQEATRGLITTQITIETPMCQTKNRMLSPDIPIILTPILRAGLIMSDAAIDMIPTASIYHIGLYRDETTLKPIIYYNKLPSDIDYSNAQFFVLDPMLATGGTVLSALQIILKLGVAESNIHFVSILATPEGIQVLTHAHPKIHIFTGAIDEKLNQHGYIVPGLGDAGDRAFATTALTDFRPA